MAKESCKLKAYKKIIDGCIFTYPRRMPIHFDGEITNLQRPLRAQTMQGERICLANSEVIPQRSVVRKCRIKYPDQYDAVSGGVSLITVNSGPWSVAQRWFRQIHLGRNHRLIFAKARSSTALRWHCLECRAKAKRGCVR